MVEGHCFGSCYASEKHLFGYDVDAEIITNDRVRVEDKIKAVSLLKGNG